MSLLSDLWKLQDIDVALQARRASLEDVQSRLADDEALVAVRAHAISTEGTLRNARAAQKDIEQEADDLRAKIAPLEAKLYGGSIRNPKELSDLQADIDQLKRHLSSVEDRDLDALATLESAEAEHTTVARELQEMESQDAAERQELTTRAEELRTELAGYDAQRSHQAAHIDPSTLRTYDHLRAAHQGRALAQLDRNLCTGCRISLPTSIVNRARGGANLVHCPNCERILVA